MHTWLDFRCNISCHIGHCAGVEALINTISKDKKDHINIFRKLVDSRLMDERLGDATTIDNLLRDIIESYNNAVSNDQKIQVTILSYWSLVGVI